MTDNAEHEATKRAVKVRPIYIIGDVAYVMLQQGGVAIVDAEDSARVGKFNWYFTSNGRGDGGGARRAILIDGKRTSLSLHRFILMPPDDALVDHINCNPLDCRKGNMRLASALDNARNRSANKKSQSGVKGVYYHKRYRKWYARITVNYKKIHLGSFLSKEDAQSAYSYAAHKYHGEFARTA